MNTTPSAYSGYILDFAGNLVPIRRFPLRTICQGLATGKAIALFT